MVRKMYFGSRLFPSLPEHHSIPPKINGNAFSVRAEDRQGYCHPFWFDIQ
jgi:hypothetical protein